MKGGDQANELPLDIILEAFKNNKHSNPTMVCQGAANKFMHKVNPGDPNYTWFAMMIENDNYQAVEE